MPNVRTIRVRRGGWTCHIRFVTPFQLPRRIPILRNFGNQSAKQLIRYKTVGPTDGPHCLSFHASRNISDVFPTLLTRVAVQPIQALPSDHLLGHEGRQLHDGYHWPFPMLRRQLIPFATAALQGLRGYNRGLYIFFWSRLKVSPKTVHIRGFKVLTKP